ncbi:MAG: hypothetical protein RBS13_02820 [Bacteroidales bacterium]|nr:hypothetical protein [Bacteroidales bacterium]
MKDNSDKMELQMGLGFLDYKMLKKFETTEIELKEMFGNDHVEPMLNNKGFNIKWK